MNNVYLIIGTRLVDFVADDGHEIRGTTLYVAAEVDGVEGMETDKLFVKAEKVPKEGLAVGAEVVVYFNKKGKVEAIAPAKKG